MKMHVAQPGCPQHRATMTAEVAARPMKRYGNRELGPVNITDRLLEQMIATIKPLLRGRNDDVIKRAAIKEIQTHTFNVWERHSMLMGLEPMQGENVLPSLTIHVATLPPPDARGGEVYADCEPWFSYEN
jgi:hypothetical protein